MLFEVIHNTDYRYSLPVSEAYLEARLTPPQREEQEVLSQIIDFHPSATHSHYSDYFGNKTTFYSMTRRHERLTVTNRMTVRTSPRNTDLRALNLSVAEVRQILGSSMADIFDYMQPTAAVPTGGASTAWSKNFFPSHLPMRDALETLNRSIYEQFTYKPGSTENSTPLESIWEAKSGVCQDFAHIMLSVLRTSGLPARYVCGYIESDSPALNGGDSKLVGSLATHAWVEVMLPGGRWVALDPTNNQWCGERHITVSLGRDFADAAPVRGTFKGAGTQRIGVSVTMRRVTEKKSAKGKS